MKNSVIFLLLFSFPFLTSSSCEKKKEKDRECPPNVICTMMYAMVNVTVKTSNDEPVELQKVKTVRKSTGEILTYNSNAKGSYIVLDDSYVKSLQNQTDTFIFSGMLDGKEIVHEPFVIGADCCHVKKVSGRNAITLP